jgi:hypothetical protein
MNFNPYNTFSALTEQICGYSCLDHFLESDTYLHCWEMLRQILIDETCHSILLDIGMPIEHGHSRYNWYAARELILLY